MQSRQPSISASIPLLTLAIVLLGYLVVLASIDAQKDVFGRLTEMMPVLPVLVLASLAAYVLRFARWKMLLASRGHSLPFGLAFRAYLAGFAFTASPGKVGELIRIRYFARMNVPASEVVSCFIFERMLDLFVLLAFASLIARQAPGFASAGVFVLLVFGAIAVTAYSRRGKLWAQYILRTARLRWAARCARIVLHGVSKSAHFARWSVFSPSIALGISAWGIQCAGFAYALHTMDVDLPWQILFSVPPAAILIGAASMMPGGIGTTEVATVALLTHFGTELDLAALAAITLRIGTIWFAILLGLAAMLSLESTSQRILDERQQDLQ